jgi:hypothetical protein
MKFIDCFIDEKGNVYKASSLIKKSENIPVEDFFLSSISLDETLRWKLVNVRDYINHYKRVRDRDLSQPIILRSDSFPMNGWHSIIRALAEGLSKLPSKRFVVDPDPDFKNE